MAWLRCRRRARRPDVIVADVMMPSSMASA
jgi:hypothetical protein